MKTAGNCCGISVKISQHLAKLRAAPFLIHSGKLFLYHAVPQYYYTTTTHTTVLRPIFRDHPGEPVPEENFWTLCCMNRLTEADTPTIRLGAIPSGLTSAHLHHPQFFTGRMPFLPPNQQCQSTEGKSIYYIYMYYIYTVHYTTTTTTLLVLSLSLSTHGDLRVRNPVWRSNSVCDPVCHDFCRLFAVVRDGV